MKIAPVAAALIVSVAASSCSSSDDAKPPLSDVKSATSVLVGVLYSAMNQFNASVGQNRVYNCPDGGTVEGQAGSFGSGHSQCLTCVIRDCKSAGVTVSSPAGVYYSPSQPQEVYGDVTYSGSFSFACTYKDLILSSPVSGTACGYDAHDVL